MRAIAGNDELLHPQRRAGHAWGRLVIQLQPKDVWFLKRMCGVEAPLVIEPDVEQRLTAIGYLERASNSVQVTAAGHAFLAGIESDDAVGSAGSADSRRSPKTASG